MSIIFDNFQEMLAHRADHLADFSECPGRFPNWDDCIAMEMAEEIVKLRQQLAALQSRYARLKEAYVVELGRE